LLCSGHGACLIDNRRFHVGGVIINGRTLGYVTAIASANADLSFNGIAVATCSGGHVVLVDTRAMRVLLMMGGHPAFVNALDAWPVIDAAGSSSSNGFVAPDPRLFVTGCDDGLIRKW
jgi:hypothetical protein